MTTPVTPDIQAPEQLPGVSRTTAIDLVTRVRDLYADAERRIAADISRRLKAGQESPQWARDKHEQAAAMRRQTNFVLAQLKKDTSREVTYAVISAHLRGGAEAARTLKRLGLGFEATPDDKLRKLLDGPASQVTKGLADLGRAFPGIAKVMRLAANLVLRVNGTHLPVLRWADDIYRKVISETALSDVVGGLATRRRASQKAWEKFLGEGITGFTDKAGKRWNLATYVEMATRAGVVQASVEGHLERLAASGLDLIIVSNAPQECIKCRPWEGKILTVKGSFGPRTVKVLSAVSDDTVDLRIAGSVEEAILAGLLHPNCRHSLNAYLPGVTRIPTHTADPEGDAARQHLRHLERQVRKEKLHAVSAIDPASAREHERKARAWQAQIREHVKATEHLGIKRKPERERINTAR